MIKARWIIGAVAVGLVAVHVGPLLLTHSEQDACSFGDVSNKEYRLFLSIASIGSWRPFMWWSDGGATLQLNRKYRELLPNSPSTAMKIAVAHAVLRALGAEFRSFDDRHFLNPDAKIQRMFQIPVSARFNRLFYFSPILRKMWIIVSVDNPLQTLPKEGGFSDLRITAYLPNLIEGVRQVDRNSEALSCPPIPEI